MVVIRICAYYVFGFSFYVCIFFVTFDVIDKFVFEFKEYQTTLNGVKKGMLEYLSKIKNKIRLRKSFKVFKQKAVFDPSDIYLFGGASCRNTGPKENITIE